MPSSVLRFQLGFEISILSWLLVRDWWFAVCSSQVALFHVDLSFFRQFATHCTNTSRESRQLQQQEDFLARASPSGRLRKLSTSYLVYSESALSLAHYQSKQRHHHQQQCGSHPARRHQARRQSDWLRAVSRASCQRTTTSWKFHDEC